MPDEEDRPDFSVEAILAAHGRKVVPSTKPGRHAFHDPVTSGPGTHRLEEDDLEETQRPVWWRKWLANYGLIPPVTASR